MNRREILARWVGFVVAGTLLIVGIQQLRRGAPAQQWASWLAAGIAVLPLALAAGRISADPHRNEQPEDQHDDGPLISLVLLLRQPRYLDEGILSRHVTNAWGIDLVDEDDAGNFLVGESPSFVINAEGRCFLVNNFEESYFTDARQAAAEIKEMRVHQIVSEHRAWLSVDLMHSDTESNQHEAYRWIGKLIAELAGDDSLAILCPQTGRINVYDPAMRSTLCGPNPLAIFRRQTTAATMQLPPGDPQMKRAMEQAQRRWPEFVEAFENRSDEQHFSVRAMLSDGKHAEIMWIGVTAIENDIVYGRLGNEPLNARGLRAGQTMHVRVDEVQDWVWTQGELLHGGFTIEALRRAERGNQGL